MRVGPTHQQYQAAQGRYLSRIVKSTADIDNLNKENEKLEEKIKFAKSDVRRAQQEQESGFDDGSAEFRKSLAEAEIQRNQQKIQENVAKIKSFEAQVASDMASMNTNNSLAAAAMDGTGEVGGGFVEGISGSGGSSSSNSAALAAAMMKPPSSSNGNKNDEGGGDSGDDDSPRNSQIAQLPLAEKKPQLLEKISKAESPQESDLAGKLSALVSEATARRTPSESESLILPSLSNSGTPERAASLTEKALNLTSARAITSGASEQTASANPLSTPLQPGGNSIRGILSEANPVSENASVLSEGQLPEVSVGVKRNNKKKNTRALGPAAAKALAKPKSNPRNALFENIVTQPKAK